MGWPPQADRPRPQANEPEATEPHPQGPWAGGAGTSGPVTPGPGSLLSAPAPPCVPQGELTITTDMEDLSTALFYDTVPDSWVARAYPSMMGLAAWYADLLLRIRVRTGFGGTTACSANLSPGPEGARLGSGRVQRSPLAWSWPRLGDMGPRVQALPLEGTPGWA